MSDVALVVASLLVITFAIYAIACIVGYLRTVYQLRDLYKRIEALGPASDEELEREIAREDALYDDC